jgi:glycosyltransferase involved in cell wall biosynthesis
MSGITKAAVLHVALNPVTGVWSVMRELSRAQAASGLYAAVGLGVIADSHWPALYARELETSGLPHYAASTPKMFGTAQILWQRIQRPPIDRWVDDLLARSGAKCCVVHFHNAWLSGAFLPLRCAGKNRARVVATFHGVNAHFRGQPVRQRLHQWLAGRLIQYGAILTSVDRANLQRAGQLLKMDARGFFVVPNGIRDTEIRSRLGHQCTDSNPFTVGHVGSIVPEKGWHILLEAVRRLREEGVNVRLILAGRGCDSEKAGQLARQYSDWLRYEGFVPNPRETILPRLDALVLMSEQEGLPMAIIEDLSVGLPVIATPVGGVPEAVVHEKNGLLVSRTVESLVQAIKRLADDRKLHAALSTQARLEFEQRFEISKTVSAYHAIYSRSL